LQNVPKQLEILKEPYRPEAIKQSTQERLDIAKKHLLEPKYVIIHRALEKYYAYTESLMTGKRVSLEIEEELNETENESEVETQD